jgi:hypothetical protein
MYNKYPNPEPVSYKEQDDLLTTHQVNQDAQLWNSGAVAHIIQSMRKQSDEDPRIQKLLSRGYGIEDIIPTLDDENLSAEVGACSAVTYGADGSLLEHQELFVKMETVRIDNKGDVDKHPFPRIPIARLVDGSIPNLCEISSAEELRTIFIVRALVQQIEIDESLGLLPNISADKLTIVPPRNTYDSYEA